MTKNKVEKKPKSNGKISLSHAYDNPYVTKTPSNTQINEFRSKMRDILNLYLYMSQPDQTHPIVKRPRFLPFLRRNLHYMQPDISYSLPKSNTASKFFNPKNSCSPMPLDDLIKQEDEELLPSSFMCPSLSFYRFRFDDRRSEYDFADIQCFRVREIDGQFEGIRAVEGAHFHMKLNEDQKIEIDLANFTPDLSGDEKERSDYLLIKTEIRADGIAVSGGRKLRSVPARQAAQSELKQAGDLEHPAATQIETKVMFGVRKVTIQHAGQQTHLIKEGRAQITLISASEINVDVENTRWTQEVDLVKRILNILKHPPPPRQPTIRVEIFVDDDLSYSTAGSALSSARATPVPLERTQNGDTSNNRSLRQRSVENNLRLKTIKREASITRSNSGTPRGSVEPQDQSCFSSASSVTNGSCIDGEKPKERGGILGIVSKQHQSEMVKAKMPQKLAWCFKMSDVTNESTSINAQLKNHNNNSFSLDPPPADVFRFTGNECAICNPEYRREFPSFVSLLYHLCTTHPRLSFKFKKNLVPIINDINEPKRSSFSPSGSQRSESAASAIRRRTIKPEVDEPKDQKPELKQCPGLIVTLNKSYNGSHEFDTSRHYLKRLALLRQGTGIKRIPGAWTRPPTFLVVKNLARYLRAYPPSKTLDELETKNHLNDGTFGGCSQWQDQHFHTHRFSRCNAPFIQLTQRRRIRDYVDVNENEKKMLNILNDFHASFRCLLMGHQFYGWNVILVNEFHDKLIHPSTYTQFIIHLTNLKRLGHLHEAELFDLVARLRHEPPGKYDPRADPKHFVHAALQQLEKQRPAAVENQKKINGRKSLTQTRNSRERSTSSNTTDDSSSTVLREPYPKRKRSFDSSSGNNTSHGVSEKKQKLQGQENEAPIEKKRHFNTQTPMDILLQNTQLHPTQVPISCFDDLACRYQFASEKHLRLIWNFCREWTRQYLEWQ